MFRDLEEMYRQVPKQLQGGSKGQLRQEGESCVVLNSLIMHKYRTKMQPGSDGTY